MEYECALPGVGLHDVVVSGLQEDHSSVPASLTACIGQLRQSVAREDCLVPQPQTRQELRQVSGGGAPGTSRDYQDPAASSPAAPVIQVISLDWGGVTLRTEISGAEMMKT